MTAGCRPQKLSGLQAPEAAAAARAGVAVGGFVGADGSEVSTEVGDRLSDCLRMRSSACSSRRTPVHSKTSESRVFRDPFSAALARGKGGDRVSQRCTSGITTKVRVWARVRISVELTLDQLDALAENQVARPKVLGGARLLGLLLGFD